MSNGSIIKIIIFIAFIEIALCLMLATINIIISDGKDNNAIIVEAIPIYTGISSFFAKEIIDEFSKEDERRKYWLRSYILEKDLKEYLTIIDMSKDSLKEVIEKKQSLISQNLNMNDYNAQLQENIENVVQNFNNKWTEIIMRVGFIKVYKYNLFKEFSDIYTNIQDDFSIAIDKEGTSAKIDLGEFQKFNIAMEEYRNKILKLFYDESL